MKADLLELPFVRRVPDGMDFWSVVVTGDWAADCHRGRMHAMKLIARMQRDEDPTILGSVVGAMVGYGKISGVEAGFIQVLALQLLQSPSLIEPIEGVVTD